MTLELSPYWETKSIPDIGTRFQRLIQRLHFAWSSRKVWSRHRCDLVLLAKPFDWPVAWFWKRSRPGLKTIMGFQGTDFFAGDRYFYSAVDAAFAVSSRVADLAEARVGRRPAFIPNPVDLTLFHPTPNTASNKEGPWQLISSGRFVGWKGFAILIEAVGRLKNRIDFRLTIAGEGPEHENLKAQIERLGLGEKVVLCGRLEAKRLGELMRFGELYIVPSIGLDACPVSALEAACTGLPLLLSDQVGLNDFLDKRDIVTYAAKNIDNLIEKLLLLHERRGESDWTDHVARHARLRDQFSGESVAQRILDLIR